MSTTYAEAEDVYVYIWRNDRWIIDYDSYSGVNKPITAKKYSVVSDFSRFRPEIATTLPPNLPLIPPHCLELI